MRLTIKNISAFLMEKGLLEPKSVVDGDFMVVQTQNRNAIFKIHIKNNKSLFVKQLVNFDPQSTYFLQKDATCLWLIKNEKAFSGLAQYVPEYYGYDPEKQVLIVEYLPEAKNLEEVYQAQRKISPEVLDQAAKILSSYHFKLEEQTLTNRAVQLFMRQLPWTFQYASNPHSGNHGHYNNSPVFSHIQGNEAYLQAMKDCLQHYEFSTLIHGDIKNVNFILQDQHDAQSLKLIDWEIADIGDPLWDVGGMIQSLITSQVIMMTPTMPYQSNTAISQEQMNQSMAEVHHFWNSYCQHQKFDESVRVEKLHKAIKFAGMRMIQTAFEHNTSSQQLLPNTIKLLQLSFSLLHNTAAIVTQIVHFQNFAHAPIR